MLLIVKKEHPDDNTVKHRNYRHTPFYTKICKQLQPYNQPNFLQGVLAKMENADMSRQKPLGNPGNALFPSYL